MAVPKRKTSKRKLRVRKRSHSHPETQVGTCPECGAAARPHRVCPSCGYYKGRQVETIEAD